MGLYEPAPILATYMARRPPGFVRNIGHGLTKFEPGEMERLLVPGPAELEQGVHCAGVGGSAS